MCFSEESIEYNCSEEEAVDHGAEGGAATGIAKAKKLRAGLKSDLGAPVGSRAGGWPRCGKKLGMKGKGPGREGSRGKHGGGGVLFQTKVDANL
jgi:hypothetical protein